METWSDFAFSDMSTKSFYLLYLYTYLDKTILFPCKPYPGCISFDSVYMG